MQQHLDQATHNEEFHNCIVKEFADKFYDWKITTIFYTSLHLLKALADKRGINIGSTHQEIEQNCNPKRHNCSMPINDKAWKNYKALYRYSHTARYEGITDIKTFEQIMSINYTFCLIHIDELKKYLRGKGLPI